MCQQDLNCERGRGAVQCASNPLENWFAANRHKKLISNAPNRTSQATKIWPLDLVGLYIPNIAMSYYLDSDKKNSMAHDKKNSLQDSSSMKKYEITSDGVWLFN